MFLRTRDQEQLRLYLRVEPSLPGSFTELGEELRDWYHDSDVLEAHIEKHIICNETETTEHGGAWPGFLAFIKCYLEYLRDVDLEDLLGTYNMLLGVLNSCITAFSHHAYGLVLLPSTVQLASAVSKLAINFERRPDLTMHLELGECTVKNAIKWTVVSIQRALTVCLTERRTSNNSTATDAKPEGKKVGIYMLANLALKLLFQCQRGSDAAQLLTNVMQSSPRLSSYPASQRVTFFYYLGRFHIHDSHLVASSLAFQAAYDQYHANYINQRRSILVYLVAVNMMLGRFPSTELCSRPEAVNMQQKFIPICDAIKVGDFTIFYRLLDQNAENFKWFMERNIHLLILKHCEMLLWRSLARRVFLITYQEPTNPDSKKAPTFHIPDLLAAARFCLQGGEDILRLTNGETLQLPFGGCEKSDVWFAASGSGNAKLDLTLVESILAKLAGQNLLRGYLSQSQSRFAITGSKTRGGPLKAGFPPFWSTLVANAENTNHVHGWVQDYSVDH